MKYVANPVIVDAFVISGVRPGAPGWYALEFEGKVGSETNVDPTMTSRMIPKVGDYYVVQSDGYAYLNPKDVFERKYSPMGTGQAGTAVSA